ncbi:MAG: hypothetical protein ACXIUM_03700 [Wenzhouxiangella sp.]
MKKLPLFVTSALVGIAGSAGAVINNPGFAPEAAFTESSPPSAWQLRDLVDRALISQADFAALGNHVFRFEVLQRGFGDNKLEQCVPRASGQDFAFSTLLRTAMPDPDLAVRLNIEFYRSEADCLEREERLSIGNDDFDFSLDIAANIWTEFRSGTYDGADLQAAGNPSWARISVRLRDRSDEGNPADPPRIVYIDRVTANGQLVTNGDFSEVEFPALVEFDQDSGPIGWTMRDAFEGAVVETRDFARSNARVFRFNQLTDAFGPNKLEQCVALPSGTQNVQFGTWVRTPAPKPELGVRLNMDFYPDIESCLFREQRIQRSDTDIFLDADFIAADTWQRVQTSSVDITDFPIDARFVRLRISARDQSGSNTPLFFDDLSSSLSNPLTTGAWFDPASDGQGFVLNQTDLGLTGFFYGYADGLPLWLQIPLYSGPVVFGQAFATRVLGVNGGVFGEPEDPNNPPVWGQAVFQFDDCDSGSVRLTGMDGDQELSLIQLAGVAGTAPDCLSVDAADQPVGLTGIWFDPDNAGQGWTLTYTPGGLVGFFYGYDVDGDPLWLLTQTPVSIEPGAVATAVLVSGRGGSFGEPVAPADLSVWGEVEFDFANCESGEIRISGLDGEQVQPLIRLIGATGLPGC